MLVGQIVRAHGVAGEVVVETYTDNPSRFEPESKVAIHRESASGRTLTVKRSREKPEKGDASRLVVAFEEVATREVAESLRGTELFVEADELSPLEEGWWEHELVGLEVFDTHGSNLGRIAEVIVRPHQDLWRVETPEDSVYLPAVPSVVQEVRVSEGKVIVDPPPGLFDDESESE